MYVAFIFGGALVGERVGYFSAVFSLGLAHCLLRNLQVLNSVADSLWESNNKGKLYKHMITQKDAS